MLRRAPFGSGAQLTLSPLDCGRPDTPACELEARVLVSFVFYMQSLFSAFGMIGIIYANLVSGLGAADQVLRRYLVASLHHHAVSIVESLRRCLVASLRRYVVTPLHLGGSGDQMD